MKKEKSCGAIVIWQGKVLMVKQENGNYGFPKGHVEEGESEVETAIREVKEETNVDIVVDITSRYTIYYYVKKNIPKEVVYFIARPKGNIELIRQLGEISQVFWADINEVEKFMQYDNIKNLWNQVKDNLVDCTWR